MIKQIQSATISMKDISDTGNYLQQKTVYLVVHGHKYADKLIILYFVNMSQIRTSLKCTEFKFTLFAESDICKTGTILKKS